MKLSRIVLGFFWFFFPKLRELCFHSEGKIAQLSTSSAENMKLGTSMCFVTLHKVLESCSGCQQTNAVQVSHCGRELKSSSGTSPGSSGLVAVHVFTRRWVCGAAQWLRVYPLWHPTVGVLHSCSRSTDSFLFTKYCLRSNFLILLSAWEPPAWLCQPVKSRGLWWLEKTYWPWATSQPGCGSTCAAGTDNRGEIIT